MPRPRSRGSFRSNLGPSQRQLRVGEMLRHALSTVLLRGDIRDPDLAGVSVTITQVKPSPDMRHATVFCEPLGGKDAGKIISALNRNKAYLRGQMGHMIDLKFTPDLRFVEDNSFAEAEKIETILKSARVQQDLHHDDEGEDEVGGEEDPASSSEVGGEEDPASSSEVGGEEDPASSSEAVGEEEENDGPA